MILFRKFVYKPYKLLHFRLSVLIFGFHKAMLHVGAYYLLIYFFLLLHARSYFGIEDTVYTYHIGTGISSNQEIKDLARWERACTAASVFAIIFSYLEERPLSAPNAEKLTAALQNRCKTALLQNLRHLKRVIPSLRDEAYTLLCDYWGEEYVNAAEKASLLS